MGSNVGVTVGTTVGVVDISVNGAVVGESVLTVGAGSREGSGKMLVGADVGESDGATVGADDGANDIGLCEGTDVCACDGALVRDSKGAYVGAMVGTCVPTLAPITATVPEQAWFAKHPCRIVIQSHCCEPLRSGTVKLNSAHAPHVPPASSFTTSKFPSALCSENN